jgi:hypothetical protein
MALFVSWSGMKHFDASDGWVALGLTAIAVGLGSYDWRIAAVVVGVLVLAIGLAASLRGS